MTALILAILCAPVFWIKILQRWQRGIYLLLVYIPFAGVATYALYPSPLPTLFKDLFFVAPAYVAFFLLRQQDHSLVRVPRFVVGAIFMLTSLVFVEMLNPGVVNWMVAAIGVK